MSRLIESIRLMDGRFHNVFYHEQRMNRSLRELYGWDMPFGLGSFLESIPYPTSGLYKFRVLYDHRTRHVEFMPYIPKLIQSLQLVEDNTISYPHKFSDRKALDRLSALRGTCDDILVVKNNEITDATYANIAFRKADCWYTPVSVLLAGTMRQSLLDQGLIEARCIRKEDIASFESFKLINAMLGFEAPEQDVTGIRV